MKRQIIAVMGNAAAGKTTFVQISKFYGYKTFEMADNLKLVEEALYDEYCDRAYLRTSNANIYDIISKVYPNISMVDLSKRLFEPMYEWYADNDLVYHNHIRRNALQYLGTEIMRKEYGADVHINAMLEQINASDEGDIAIGSVRFINEIEALKKNASTFIPLIIDRDGSLNVSESAHVSEKEWKKWTLANKSFVIPNKESLHYFIVNSSKFIKEMT